MQREGRDIFVVNVELFVMENNSRKNYEISEQQLDVIYNLCRNDESNIYNHNIMIS